MRMLISIIYNKISRAERVKYGKEIYIDEKNEPTYESIDPITLENSNVRTVGAEHAVYQTL